MTLLDREHNTLLHTYKRFPVEIVSGKGMYLFDRNGNAYLDFLGGIAVNALGYGNEKLLNAISQQAAAYIHVSNYFLQVPQIELAEKLAHVTGYPRVFFCNSGTEASEAALKLVRKWGIASGKTEIISMHNAFHGRTMGSLSMMNSEDYRAGFGPFLKGFKTIPLNDSGLLESMTSEKTAAVFIECIQGEGGINEVSEEFLRTLAALKKRFGFLVVADEVQAGIGRTGKFFSFEHYGLLPDVVTLAKPLGGGLPLGAMLVGDAARDVLKPGNHGTTFGGNPVACAAGKVVLEEVVNNGLMTHASEIGNYLRDELKKLKEQFPQMIKEVRGKGLMLGVELTQPGKPIVDAMLEKKVIINCTHDVVLRLVPPLIVERKEVDQLMSTLQSVLSDEHVDVVSH